MSSNYEDIENNIKELNDLFAISTVANQATDIIDLITKTSNFIDTQIKSHILTFYILDGGSFKSVPTSQNSAMDEYFEFEEDNEALWAVMNSGRVIETTNSEHQQLYNSFWQANVLEKLNTKYLRAFFKNEIPVCFCFIGADETQEKLKTEEIAFLDKIFDFLEPIIAKLVDRKEKDDKIVELQKSLYNISILYNISQAVNFIDDLKRLLQVILSKALVTLEAERGSLMLYDYRNNCLQVKVVYGLSDKTMEENINNGFIQTSKIRAGEGVAGTVFLEKKAVITNLGSNDPRFIQKNTLSNTQSLLCVPLIAKGEAIGVINITNKKHNKLFNQKDLDFMTSLANQAAIAIDNAKLYELATKDGLTKLYIYRHFYTLLENEIRRCARYRHNMTLLMIDIDDFKDVNDKYGHLAGDQVLREISNEIMETVRKIDTPARYGGEEFAIILPETTKEEALVIAERLRFAIEKLRVKVKKDVEISATISIGVAQFDFEDTDPKVLIESADKALYHSKNNGKNIISMYSAEGCAVVKYATNYESTVLEE